MDAMQKLNENICWTVLFKVSYSVFIRALKLHVGCLQI